MHFYSDGRLYQIADANGNTQTVAYDSAKKITSVTDGAGRVYPFTYSGTTLALSLIHIYGGLSNRPEDN